MKYALNLNTDNRIHSACVVLPRGNYDGMPIVETLPDGNLPDYLYIDNEYIYDPIPVEEVVSEPTEAEDTAAMLIDHEYRLTLLELGITNE